MEVYTFIEEDEVGKLKSGSDPADSREHNNLGNSELDWLKMRPSAIQHSAMPAGSFFPYREEWGSFY